MKVNIQIFPKEIIKNKELTLFVKPINQLCITNSPGDFGSFSSTQDIEQKILGMIENMMNIDVNKESRKIIISKIKKKYTLPERFNDNKWYSIFSHLIDVELKNEEILRKSKRFVDLKKRLQRRPWSDVHMQGCESKTEKVKLFFKVQKLYKDKKWEELKEITGIDFSEKTGRFDEKDIKRIGINFNTDIPYFSKNVTKREQIMFSEKLEINLKITEQLYNEISILIKESNLKNNVYLGDSESLVILELFDNEKQIF